MEKKYRYDLNSLLPIAITVVVVALVVAYGLQILSETQSDMATENTGTACGTNSTGGSAGTILYTNCGSAYNATGDGLEAVAKISTKLGTIVTVVLAVVVIGVLIFYFGRKMG